MLIEDNEEEEGLSEVEEIDHVKSGEKPKQKDLKKRRTKKSFTCTQCGTSFTNKYDLELHMRVHTGQKPFTCDQCGKSFSQSSSLKDHINIHTREKLYTCDQCGKTFLRSSHLKNHLRVHTKEKPHSCFCVKRVFHV